MRRMVTPAPGPGPTRRNLLRLAAGGAAAATAACAAPFREPAVPQAYTGQATVLGVPNERFFPAISTGPIEAEFAAALARQRKARGLPPGAKLPELQLIAISGGGEDGAFGAGLLNGWTLQGGRPTFDLVTGVSTGALTAPFAFLGSRYDDPLKRVYTGLSPDRILRTRPLLSAIFSDALTSNEPLFETISAFLNDQMLADIGAAYANGRLLLVGTTNLDARQPVLWNIGAIAASGHPSAAETIRRVLLASAAIPGAFPPSMIDVTLDGRSYQEMHVDGGAFAQVFLYPSAVTAGRRESIRVGDDVQPAIAYIIRNSRLDPSWADTERRTLSIASRAISTMIFSAGFNDVVRIYKTTQQDGVAYRLAYIGNDFTEELPSPFDQKFMRDLFDYGFAQGKSGYRWADRPPLF